MRPQTGRKAYIILSDGVSVRDKASIGTAIEFAQRADVIIYSILFSRASVGLGRGGPLALYGRKAMQRLADETGGGYFEVTAKHPIEQIGIHFAGCKILQLLAHELPELLGTHLVAGKTDHRKFTRKQVALGQIVERGKELAGGKIARGAKNDHHTRTGLPGRFLSISGVAKASFSFDLWHSLLVISLYRTWCCVRQVL